MSDRTRRLMILLPLLLLSWLAAACAKTVTTDVLTVARPLPRQEEAHYRVLNDKGEQIGTAVLSIAPEGDDARLTVAYDFGPEQKDSGYVIVHRDTMKPVRMERRVVDGSKTYVTRAEYGSGEVVVTLDDGGKGRRSEVKLTDSAYDNLESLFLWRTLDQNVGQEARYGNIIIDPKRGGVSRAVATLESAGKATVELSAPAGSVAALRALFRSAGVTNTAWYQADEGRRLLKYDITRGPTLVFERATP